VTGLGRRSLLSRVVRDRDDVRWHDATNGVELLEQLGSDEPRLVQAADQLLHHRIVHVARTEEDGAIAPLLDWKTFCLEPCFEAKRLMHVVDDHFDRCVQAVVIILLAEHALETFASHARLVACNELHLFGVEGHVLWTLLKRAHRMNFLDHDAGGAIADQTSDLSVPTLLDVDDLDPGAPTAMTVFHHGGVDRWGRGRDLARVRHDLYSPSFKRLPK
jgi:hypothetical protein